MFGDFSIFSSYNCLETSMFVIRNFGGLFVFVEFPLLEISWRSRGLQIGGTGVAIQKETLEAH